MSELESFFRVQTREDWFDGCPFPWQDSPIGWTTFEAAKEEFDSMIKRKPLGMPALELRILRISVDVLAETRVEGGPG